jgi:hypothetical protein
MIAAIFLDLPATGTVTSAFLIYQQVSTDHRRGSGAVTHHSQNYCHMRNRQNIFFLELEHKKMLKIVKNVLWQHQILLICLLVPIIAIPNLVTLSL